MVDKISFIRKPIERELEQLVTLFRTSLSSDNPLLHEMLEHICKRSGKMMRPILVLLMAKRFGTIDMPTLHAAATLELLHTASLVHDDVVDESSERRGQPSVNDLFNNKLAVLVGDYLLSTALNHSAQTDDIRIVNIVARLGQNLAEGEILQLSNVSNHVLSESVYFDIINKKTASLFEACARAGALSVNASEKEIEWATLFGEIVGTVFQIKDDIFDYFDNADIIGKPTGNDMREGKLTLPALHVLIKTQNKEMLAIASKIKNRNASDEEIAELIAFTKDNGGIVYAEQKMNELVEKGAFLLKQCNDEEVKEALKAYLYYVVERTK